MNQHYWPLYEVFVRSHQGLSHRHVGSLHAADDQMALENARDAYTRRSEGCSIWVVKAAEIIASQPEDRGEFSSQQKAKFTAIPPSTNCLMASSICEVLMDSLTTYVLRLGDNGLVLSQRLGAWCGHAPELEIDLALANIGLDILGQARNFLTYAAQRLGDQDEDSLAFQRDERQFCNLLLVEQPNGHFGDTLVRQYFIDAWHVALYSRLITSQDRRLRQSRRKP